MMESCNSIIIWVYNFTQNMSLHLSLPLLHPDPPQTPRPLLSAFSSSFPFFHLLFLRLFHRLFCHFFPHTRNPANEAPGSLVGRASDSGSRSSGIKTRAGNLVLLSDFHLTSANRRALLWRRPHFLQSCDPQFPGKGLIIIVFKKVPHISLSL